MRCLVVLLALAPCLGACVPAPAPLSDTRPSATVLAQDVLAALAAGDEAVLDGLALSEEEFRDYVWPDLPAARPERNLPFSYVWGDLRQKSRAGLQAALAVHRGQPYAVVDVRFDGATTYGRSVVHRDSVFVVRRGDSPAEELQVCGSFLERDGRWKVFSYVTDE